MHITSENTVNSYTCVH